MIPVPQPGDVWEYGDWRKTERRIEAVDNGRVRFIFDIGQHGELSIDSFLFRATLIERNGEPVPHD